jgi:hypothetical protein
MLGYLRLAGTAGRQNALLLQLTEQVPQLIYAVHDLGF